MATETSLGPEGRPMLGQLWQVPAFLVGLLAVVAVGATGPLWSARTDPTLDRDVAAIRRALDQPRGPVAGIQTLAVQVLARTRDQHARAGEAHFLLGSVYQRLADQTGPEQAGPLRQQALDHLDQAARLGVPPGDRPRLLCRLGKAVYQAGTDLPRAIDLLSRATAQADDPAEAYHMLAQAHLGLKEPNLEAAYQANLKLMALPIDDEKVLGPARLMCGDILSRQQKPGEALKMLETIGPAAPPEVLSRARYLQARCCQDLHMWEKAVPLWEQVLRDSTPVPGGRGPVYYYLGLCYHNQEHPDDREAAREWERALAEGLQTGQAAAFRLAELRLGTTAAGELIDPAGALEAYRHALEGVSGPQDYHNTLIDLDKARDLIASGCQVYRTARDYQRALDLVELYRKVALPGAAEDLEGQTAEAWARDLLTRAAPPAKQIEDLLVRAAAAYEAEARTLSGKDAARLLWHSANCYLQGRHHDRGVAILEQFVRQPVAEDWLGEAWLTLAEAREVLGRKDAARQAYVEATNHPGPFAFRARYQLALAEIQAAAQDPRNEAAHLNQAEDLLKNNQEGNDRNAALAPADVKQKTYFQLASLRMRRGKYDDARFTLVEAMANFADNPALLFQAHELLAECCRRLADQEIEYCQKIDPHSPEAQSHNQQTITQYLEQAIANYQAMREDLEARQTVGGLSEDEEALLRKVRFWIMNCRFTQGGEYYPEALRLARELADRYAQEPEGLLACQLMWSCAGILGRPNDYQEALARARKILDGLPDGAFQRPGMVPRNQFKDWIESAAAHAPKPVQ